MLRHVIVEILNSIFLNNEQGIIHRYNVMKTNKNIVISAKNITEAHYSIIVFKDIDAIQKFEH